MFLLSHKHQKEWDHFHRFDQAYFQDSKLPGRFAIRTGHFHFLARQEMCKMVQPFTGHCRSSLANLMGWSNPIRRVTAKAPVRFQLLHNKHSRERRERARYGIVSCPALGVFPGRQDAPVRGTGENVSCPGSEGSLQFWDSLIAQKFCHSLSFCHKCSNPWYP